MKASIRLKDFLELYHQGLNDTAIGEILGFPYSTVRKVRVRQCLPPNRRWSSKTYFKVFCRDTGELLVEGDNETCADFLGIHPASFRKMQKRKDHSKYIFESEIREI